LSYFRKKPVVIEAVQVTSADYNHSLHGTEHNPWDGPAFSDLPSWLVEAIEDQRLVPHTRNHTDYAEWDITTLEGVMTASAGDWIIKGVKGELYPCKPDIFEATYEQVKIDHVVDDGIAGNLVSDDSSQQNH
jgi:hypothetical protein